MPRNMSFRLVIILGLALAGCWPYPQVDGDPDSPTRTGHQRVLPVTGSDNVSPAAPATPP